MYGETGRWGMGESARRGGTPVGNRYDGPRLGHKPAAPMLADAAVQASRLPGLTARCTSAAAAPEPASTGAGAAECVAAADDGS